MAKILHLDLYRRKQPLFDLTDPCTQCDKQSGCTKTCELANVWWERFARMFKRQGVVNKLGVE